MSVICKDCGTVNKVKTVTRGSMGVELILWLCFLVPGLIYSIWRLTTRHEACAACGGISLLPVTSPIGAALAESNGYIEPVRNTAAAQKLGRRLGAIFHR